MPKEVKEEVEQKDTSVSLDAIDKLVSSFKDVANRPVNVTVQAPGQPEPDPVLEAKRRQEELTTKYKDVRAQYNELVQNGDAAAAYELMAGFLQEQAASNPQPKAEDPLKHPAVKSLITLGEQNARQRFAAEFEKYGDEIKEYFDGLSAEQKMDINAWEDAIGTIRTRHWDDFIEQAREEERQAQRESVSGNRVMAPGSRGRSRTDANVGEASLSEEELGVARSFGMSDEDYVRQRETIEKTRKRDFFPLLDDDVDDRERRIEPGKF